MKPKTSAAAASSRSFQGEGPNWVLIAGGALLSTLSIRLGFKLKQAIDTNHKNPNNTFKGNAKFSDRRKPSRCRIHSNLYSFTEDDDGTCFNCLSGTGVGMDISCQQDSQMMTESNGALPLVTVPAPEFNKDNGVMWSSSPDRLELPPKPFNHHSNCSDSPCVSESGSDVYSKREVIHKLRQQLKRRDDMILEMQDQIVELQTSFNSQLAHSTHLQSQIDATNRDLFDSEREIQRLRKAIADHCVGQSNDKSSTALSWSSEGMNGHANGYHEGESNLELPEKGRGAAEKIEMLKREVGELKEVIEGKDYLLQSYKEQKAELTLKIKELQQRLDSQLPNIL
ncbi:uncharacterized protein LOC133834177 isoform X1 [Humulus lupulus]|uniref:uncharacterized protein LOC133834177 isoform X1 n=1 Tax=Humulus lupulus TaxID=3486 RepID=UPI002B416C77|nr:uncharacterized protein LOC133834177 isoform X1 [Humulus lupulus]XP_062119675.1 uncharacterized protein LOC133834177 isoform X1 [Humulus lupulus]